MILAYTAKLELTTQKINIGVQKIYNTVLETYNIITTRFLFQNYLKKTWFFKKTFLLVNTNMEVILEIPFLLLNNINVEFTKKLRKLIWGTYIGSEALPITNWVEIINKMEFAKVRLDVNLKTFIIYVSAQKLLKNRQLLFLNSLDSCITMRQNFYQNLCQIC